MSGAILRFPHIPYWTLQVQPLLNTHFQRQQHFSTVVTRTHDKRTSSSPWRPRFLFTCQFMCREWSTRLQFTHHTLLLLFIITKYRDKPGLLMLFIYVSATFFPTIFSLLIPWNWVAHRKLIVAQLPKLRNIRLWCWCCNITRQYDQCGKESDVSWYVRQTLLRCYNVLLFL